MKEKPLKNYIIFLILTFFTVFVVFFITKIYKQNIEYNNQNNNIMSFLSEVKKEEFNTYILENHDAIIYLSSSIKKENEDFERELRRYIKNKNLVKNVVYLDVNALDDKFYQDLKDNYLSKKLKEQDVDLKVVPNLFVFKDEKIVSVLYRNNPSKLNPKVATEFINNYWIKEQ